MNTTQRTRGRWVSRAVLAALAVTAHTLTGSSALAQTPAPPASSSSPTVQTLGPTPSGAPLGGRRQNSALNQALGQATAATSPRENARTEPPAPEKYRIPRSTPLGIELDMPIAMVGERMILRSELDRLLLNDPRIRASIAAAVSSRQRMGDLGRLELQSLRDMIDQAVLHHSIYTLEPTKRQQIESAVDRMIQDEQQRSIQQVGGVQAYLRELQRSGETPEERLRRGKDRQIANFMAGHSPPLQQGGNQFTVTPAEMRRFFDENPQLFNQPARVDLATARFSEKADAAAAKVHWATIDLDPTAPTLQLQDLKKRWPGAATGLARQPAGRDTRAPWMLEFAGGAALGQVSDPIQVGEGYYLLRVIAKAEEVHDEFSDRDVQDAIREELSRRYFTQLRNRNMIRYARASTRWSPLLGDR